MRDSEAAGASSPSVSAAGPASRSGGSLADFLTFGFRHRRLIAAGAGIPALAALVVMVLVPVEYTATAVVLPAASVSPSLLSAARALIGSRLGSAALGGTGSELAVQEGVIRSRRIADLMNEEFGLDRRYRTKKREARLREWESRLGTKSSKQGLLTVGYRDRDPEFATRVVTRLLEELDRFNRESRSTTSRRVRIFLEGRLAESEVRLRAVEDSLAAYQAAEGMLALSSDSEEGLAASAQLLTQKVRLETEAQMLRRSLGERAPALAAKEIEIAALRRELARLPALNTELSRLLRSRQVYERSHAFLAAQLEEARVEEARNTPTVDLLDPPVVPEEKSWPRRGRTVIAVFVVALGLSLLAARLLDAVSEARRRTERVRG